MPNKQQSSHEYFLLDFAKGDLRIPKAGKLIGKTFSCDFTSKDFFAISFILQGKGVWRKDDGPTHPIKNWSCFLVHPGHRYRFGPKNGTSWNELYILLKGAKVEQWQKIGLLPIEDKPKPIPQPLKFRNLFLQLFSMEKNHSQFKGFKILNLIEQLLIERSIQLEADRSEFPDVVQKILKECWQTHHANLDFEKLALSMHVSYSYLRKIFREHIGIPPQKYLNKVRANKAQRLLDDPNISITEVADRLNYHDLFTFSRQFKTATGQSPSAYRGY